MSDGWGPRGQKSFDGGTASWTTSDLDTIAQCEEYGFTLTDCNGSLAQIYADTGIFYSTDPRTQFFTADGSDMATDSNGYHVEPSGEGGVVGVINNLKKLLGMEEQDEGMTQNLWDADQTNAFGTSGSIPSDEPHSDADVYNGSGSGATPYNAGSAVAGPDSGYQLDNTGNVGPWQRIAYQGSRIGNPTAPATSKEGSGNNIGSLTAVVGESTNMGWQLSSDNPLPSNTNAVRFALGQIKVGIYRYVKISLRITEGFSDEKLVLNTEVVGGDSAQAGGKDGKDSPWRYYVASTALNIPNTTITVKEIEFVPD